MMDTAAINTHRRSSPAWRLRCAAARGFSVIEVLVAFVVLLVGVLGTLGTLASTFGGVDDNGVRIQATAAGQQYMDSIRQWQQTGGTGSIPAPPLIPIDAGQDNQGTAASLSSPGNFDFSSVPGTCTQLGAASSKQYDCKVTVGWTTGGVTRQLTVESYVTRQQ